MLARARCFVRLGEPGDTTGVAAEWHAEGVPPLGDASRLPVVNLCGRLGRTVAVADVLGVAGARGQQPRATCRGLSDHGVQRRPRDADRRAGAVARRAGLPPSDRRRLEPRPRSRLPRPSPGRLRSRSTRPACSARATAVWPSRRRCSKAGEALTSDLRFDVVIERLVSELRALVNADAADCWTLAAATARARLPGGAGAARGRGRADDPGRRHHRRGDHDRASRCCSASSPTTEQPPADGGDAAFAEVMDAPISSFGEIRGALGVYSQEAGRFDESDLRLIEAFASLASIALRNAEAYEESTRRAQIERGFYRIAAVLSEPLSEAGDTRRRRAGGCRRARRRARRPCSAATARRSSWPAPTARRGASRHLRESARR